MISFEDFLLRPLKVVDPFNRFVSHVKPFLVTVEFCQVIGPRPLFVISSEENADFPGLDINSLSVWLMSSETAPTTVVTLDDTQTGIHAIVYYFTMYDVRARAFQRPLCTALLCSEKPSKQMLRIFEKSVSNALAPVILCNRRSFLRSVNDIVKLSDVMDLTTIQNYYTLNSDNGANFPDMNRLANVLEQTRILKSRVLAVDSSFDKRWSETICLGHNEENLDEAEDIVRSFRNASVPLQPIEELAPCAFSQLKDSLKIALIDCDVNNLNSGVLFSAGVSILKLPKTETTVHNDHRHAEIKKVEEETLRMVSGNIAEIIYPILAGDDVAVCGSEQRKKTVIDIVEKLNRISPTTTGISEETRWLTDRKTGVKGVFGMRCSRNNVDKSLRNVMDMNRCVLRSVGYDGSLLAALNRKRRFPSDQSFLLFIAAFLTDVCSVVYLARALPSLSSLKVPLAKADERIVVNLLAKLDFIKYHALKSTYDSWVAEKPQRNVSL